MNFFRRYYKWIGITSVTVIVLVTCISLYTLRNISFRNDFDSFFPVNNAELDTYLQFRETFEHDDEFLLIALENDEGIFHQDFLTAVHLASDSLAELRNVISVEAPTAQENITISDFGPPLRYPYLHINEPERYAEDSALIYRSEQLVGSFFGTDRKSVCIFIRTKAGMEKATADSLVDAVSRVTDQFAFDHVRVVGKAKGQQAYGERIAKEFRIFFIASVILLIVFLWISFRSLWLIWIPLFIVVLATIWTLALMTAMGKPLDIMTVLLPTMMFVIGVSDVVHIVTKYLEELRKPHENRFDVLVKTIREVGFVTFLTLLTTSLGFLSLLNSRIIPIRDFGMYTSIGVFIGFVLSFAIVPFTLNIIPAKHLQLERKSAFFWNNNLHRLLLWVFAKRRQIVIGAIVIIGASIYGLTQIERNNYMLEGLTAKDEGRKVFMYFEENFSGARPFEMLVTPRDSSGNIMSAKQIQAIGKLEQYLKENYHAGFLLSPASLIKEANKAEHSGDPAFYTVPADTAKINELIEMLAPARKREQAKMLVTTNGKQGRITGKMHDIGSKAIAEQNEKLYAFMKSDPAMSAINIHLTGAAVMLDKNNEYLVENTIQGLLFSVLVVALIVGLIHRSLTMAFIAIIPNLVPILIIGGLMGFLGIDMKSTTAIIFAIAFGIATDDTVHYLGRLKLELSKGKTLLYAIKRTYISTGKAVIVTSIILSAGFMSLMVSGFQSTFQFGMLVSITLLAGIIVELLLFPLLVMWLFRKQIPTAK